MPRQKNRLNLHLEANILQKKGTLVVIFVLRLETAVMSRKDSEQDQLLDFAKCKK